MKQAVDKYREVSGSQERSSSSSANKKSEKLVDGLTKEETVIKYASLVKYLAQKIAMRLPANIELDDLISAGVIGLMDAVDKYDCTRDNKFKTYAEFRIRGAMLDELRSQDWVPRSVREKAKQLERVYAKIEQDKGRPATDQEVCEVLNLSQEEYQELLNEVRSVSLLNFDDLNGMAKTDKKSMMGLIENGKMSSPLAEVTRNNLKSLVEKAINDLPEKQRLVLALYYYEDMNLKEIGRVLEVTESRVSQLHTQAIIRLKSKLKNKFDDFIQMLA
jgi:RNA polymerase sigma factor FliA